MKKLVSVLLAAVTLCSVLALSSCSKSSSGGETINQGVLTVGVDDSYPPMEYKDDSGKTVGFDVDMANEIGKRMGLKVEFVSTAWDGIFTALKTKRFDCIISSVSITEERLKSSSGVIFTKPYIANAQMIVVKPGDNSITKPEDLNGKKVGCQTGTTAEDSAKYLLEKKGYKFTLQTYGKVIEPFSDMKTGRLDAIIVDEVVGQYYIGKDSASYKAAAAKLTNEPIGVCFKSSDTVLRDKVQKVIDAMESDGTMKNISNTWFKTDLTSNIDSKLKDLQ